MRAGYIMPCCAVALFLAAPSGHAADCTEGYVDMPQPVADFLDKKIGKRSLQSLENAIADHGLTSSQCSMDGWDVVYLADTHCIRLNDTIVRGKGGGLFMHDGVYSAAKYGTSYEINFGIILDNKYNRSDVKQSLNNTMPGFPDNFSENNFVNDYGAKKYKNGSNFYTISALIYGGYSDEDWSGMTRTYIDFTVGNKTNDVLACIATERQKQRERENVNTRGKSLIIK